LFWQKIEHLLKIEYFLKIEFLLQIEYFFIEDKILQTFLT